MKQPIFRDGIGRIVGVLDFEWFNDEDESYFDFKEEALIFPRHNQNMNGEVHTYHISELKDK